MATNTKQTDDVYDSVVVGAGVEGSATAYKLAESGQRTLLLEQFELLHLNGSSHGGSRITRHSYDKKCFMDMAFDQFAEWEKVEKLCGQKLYVKTGLVTFGRKPCPIVEAVIENLRQKEIPHRVLANGEELRKAIPNTNYSDDYCGVHEPSAGILKASKAVACLQELVRKFGGEIVDKCEVVDIEPGLVITLRTKDGQAFRTKNLILCVGTWAGHMAKKVGLDLPVTLLRCFVVYWKVKSAADYSLDSGMPCIVDTCTNGCYGMPSQEYPGYVKLAIHGGYEYKLTNAEEHEHKSPYNYDTLINYVQNNYPRVDMSSPPIIEKCKYTMTPDGNFILDQHPKHENIFLAAGFSGTGFKMAPVVGNILRNFVLGQPQKYDLHSFRLDRFDTKSLTY